MVIPVSHPSLKQAWKEVGGEKILIYDSWYCIDCHLCLPECSNNAINIIDDKWTLDPMACDMLGDCIQLCPMPEALYIENPDDCMDQVEFGGETSMTYSVSTTSQSASTRTRSYQWIFYVGPMSIWEYRSYEQGTHKKVTVNGVDEWQWVSFTHDNVGMIGTMPAVGISAFIGQAISTVGIYNASMTLIGGMTFSFVCNGAPVPYTRPFNITMLYNVNYGF